MLYRLCFLLLAPLQRQPTSTLVGKALTNHVRVTVFYPFLVAMLYRFPGVILPVWTSNAQDEFYLGWGPNFFDLVLLSFASVFEVILLVFCVPMFLFLPGSSIDRAVHLLSSHYSPHILSYAGALQRSGQRRPWIQKWLRSTSVLLEIAGFSSMGVAFPDTMFNRIPMY
jgi:hypothetical protein